MISRELTDTPSDLFTSTHPAIYLQCHLFLVFFLDETHFDLLESSKYCSLFCSGRYTVLLPVLSAAL